MPTPRQPARSAPRSRATFDLLLDAEHQRLIEQVEGIADKVDGVADKTAQVAVVLERLTNFFQDHDRRLTALEANRPTFGSLREWSAVGISMAVFLFYIVQLVSQHWK